jgi:NitT/TauT family transport system substrate-binding protein
MTDAGLPADVTIYSNQAQANTVFLRGDVPIFVTGLAVGVDFFKNGVPVQAVNSYVSGLTYLVTYGKPVKSLAELKGGEIYMPFRGSPIEETTQYFAQREGLTWGQDLKPVYAPFASSVELLKQGKAAAVALPEPFVTLVEKQAPVSTSLSYRQRWDELTGSTSGYPQVITFVKRDWAEAHPEAISRFNQELARAIESIARDPSAAVDETYATLGLPRDVLASALARTDLAYRGPEAAEQDVRGYYQTIGKPLDESYASFFYRSPQ